MNVVFYKSADATSILTGKDPAENDTHKIYYNSPSGRADLAAEQPPEIVSQVMEVWAKAALISPRHR